jgi:hypothetical protein
MSTTSLGNTLVESVKRDYVGISLWITSETLTVEMISQLVGIEPSYSQRLGDVIGQTKRRYERHSWNLGRRLYAEHDAYMGDHTERFLNEFLQSLEVYASKIREIIGEHSVSIDVIYNVRDMPFIGLTSEQVQAVATLGARVSFDVMVYGSSSE